jgi:hypothetical protein
VGFGRFKISDIDAEEKLTDEEVEKYTKASKKVDHAVPFDQSDRFPNSIFNTLTKTNRAIFP